MASRDGGWVLYHNQAGDKAPWRNLMLARYYAGMKSAYFFGWDGKRISNSRDAVLLKKHHPEVHAWVAQSCRVHYFGMEIRP